MVVQMCEAIDDLSTGNETFTKLHAAANIFYNHSGTVKCFDLGGGGGGGSSSNQYLGGWSWQVQNILI